MESTHFRPISYLFITYHLLQCKYIAGTYFAFLTLGIVLQIYKLFEILLYYIECTSNKNCRFE